jgi:methylthioribose-1-phosphate isomerase
MMPKTVEWKGGLDGCVVMIDQTLLPGELRVIECRTPEMIWEAIKVLRVRGAPAIGVAAAMGAFLGIQNLETDDAAVLLAELRRVADYLNTSRPTAVNLSWAVKRMVRVGQENATLPVPKLKARILREANNIRDEDEAMCRAIGEHAVHLFQDGDGVLTHCNAGALATSAYGTALSPMFVAKEQGKTLHIYADETRPLLQGARLTAWELMQAGIDVTLITDSMAGQVMKEGRIQRIIVGADRIAANGDAANKIGTYSVSVLAKEHSIPFYVAAPSNTFDLDLPDGSAIPIEERDAEEITESFGKRTAPDGVKVYAPAFDVTPAAHIAAIITERGVIENPTTERIRAHFEAKQTM